MSVSPGSICAFQYRSSTTISLRKATKDGYTEKEMSNTRACCLPECEAAKKCGRPGDRLALTTMMEKPRATRPGTVLQHGDPLVTTQSRMASGRAQPPAGPWAARAARPKRSLTLRFAAACASCCRRRRPPSQSSRASPPQALKLQALSRCRALRPRSDWTSRTCSSARSAARSRAARRWTSRASSRSATPSRNGTAWYVVAFVLLLWLYV